MAPYTALVYNILQVNFYLPKSTVSLKEAETVFRTS